MQQVEETLFRLLNGLCGQSAFIDNFMFRLSDSQTWTFAGLAFFVYAYSTKNRELAKIFWCAMIALACTDVISFEIIKPLVGRERPCWLLADVKLYAGRCGGSYGFTSNHAANGFAVWAAVVKVKGRKSRLAMSALSIATLVAFSRVYLGVHFVGDVVGGALLGVFVTTIIWNQGLESWSTWIVNKSGPKIPN
jgi:undecaprenyl-diphosphatase